MRTIDDIIRIKKFVDKRTELNKKIDQVFDELLEILSKRENYGHFVPPYLEDARVKKISEKEQLKTQLEELISTEKEYESYDLMDVDKMKEAYLRQLLTSQHISVMEEEPSVFFGKMIELYGEGELTTVDYTEKREIDFDDYDELDNSGSNVTYRISDFVSGHEDEIIGQVTNQRLRETLLASRLSSWKDTVAECFQEYIDAASEKGHRYYAWTDEHGDIDMDATLLNFSDLPISKDRNFYAYLATHLDEIDITTATFFEYVDPEMMDSEFGPEICKAINTKQYEYKIEYDNQKSIEDVELLKWLNSKEEELSRLEAEERTISEAEALIDKQTGKDGQDIGEE